MASSPDKQATKREHPCRGCATYLRDCDLHGGFDCVGGCMIIDRKTGREVVEGETLIRKNYKGFKFRYEVLDFIGGQQVRVRKLDNGDRWVYLTVPIASLQLDEVMV